MGVRERNVDAAKLLSERKTAEARLHKSDFVFGMPLDIGDGYSVAYHAADCPYCAFLKERKNGRTQSQEPKRAE
jgi:hypothetical protein